MLAHSTHVKGLGTYDAATGVETPRIQVTLATGIPEERCRRINLGYLDPAGVRRRRRGRGARPTASSSCRAPERCCTAWRPAATDGSVHMHCDIGVVGLGVMGGNLALNMERHGFRIAGYDLDAAKAQAFVAGPAAGRHVELARVARRR